MKSINNKRVIIILLMLLSMFSLQSQTSRLTFGLGGGISVNESGNKAENMCCPMGTFNFGYSILGSTEDSVLLGFRTGLNLSYFKIGNAIQLNETFTNIDYEGNSMDYTVTSKRVSFEQKQLNLELPLMFAIDVKNLYINLGVKLMFPLSNSYEQVIEDPQISAFYSDYGVTVVNDVITGCLSDAQMKTSGKASIPDMMVGLSAEIGYFWKLKNAKGNLGFDLFVDYVPWSVGGVKDNNKNIVEVAPIINDCEQPKAVVTVNPMNQCNGFTYKNVFFGAKLVYTFDIEHKKSQYVPMFN